MAFWHMAFWHSVVFRVCVVYASVFVSYNEVWERVSRALSK